MDAVVFYSVLHIERCQRTKHKSSDKYSIYNIVLHGYVIVLETHIYIVVVHGRRKPSKVTILTLWVFHLRVDIFIHFSKSEQNSGKFS